MTKNYTREEFVEYVKNLELQELEDIASFITEYFNHYNSIPNEDAEQKQLAWEKYVILLSRYGQLFISFATMVMELRDNAEKAIKDGQDS
jgi:hypothetical protein